MKTIKIGRNPDNDIVIKDETRTVSGYHAVLKVYDTGEITLCDFSTNGTKINGVKATRDVDVHVTKRDKILLGPYVLLDWSLIDTPFVHTISPGYISPPPNFNPQQSSSPPQEMFNELFSFEGRIRRLEYGISSIIYGVVAFFINYKVENDYSLVWIYIAYIPMIWIMLAQNTKRCHDLGNSGWYQLIPFYGLWLLFAEGARGNNKYGRNPKGVN